MKKQHHRMVHKPDWIEHFEHALGNNIPFSPNLISSLKLFIITPLLYLSLNQLQILPNSTFLVSSLFLLFCLIDYLDGIVARAKKRVTTFGMFYDRLTDFPLLIIVSLYCLEFLPRHLIYIKLTLDLFILIQFLLGRAAIENRIRTAINYTLLVSLLFLSQQWFHHFFTVQVVLGLLYLNLLFNAIVFIYNLNFFHKKYIADLLSSANLVCGLISIYFAYHNRFEISLLFLMLGAAFDGFDGAAARKFGSTPWGVYSDDVADTVNYAIAPGMALIFCFKGYEGLVIGICYIVFTVSRLIFFTLNKDTADPNFFSGVPSTIGGLVVLCSLILFQDNPLLVGLFTGIACMQMVSFDTSYRHPGRALTGGSKRYIFGLPFLALLLIIGSVLWNMHLSVLVLLIIILLYGFAPVFLHMKRVIFKR